MAEPDDVIREAAGQLGTFRAKIDLDAFPELKDCRGFWVCPPTSSHPGFPLDCLLQACTMCGTPVWQHMHSKIPDGVRIICNGCTARIMLGNTYGILIPRERLE